MGYNLSNYQLASCDAKGAINARGFLYIASCAFIWQTILTHSRSISSSSFSDYLILEVGWRWGRRAPVLGGLGLLSSVGGSRGKRRLLVCGTSLSRTVGLTTSIVRTWMLLMRWLRSALIVSAVAWTLNLAAQLSRSTAAGQVGGGASGPNITWRWVLLLRGRGLTIPTIMASLSTGAHFSATSRVARARTARTWWRRFVQIWATTTMVTIPRLIVLTPPFSLVISLVSVLAISLPIPISSPISWIIIVWRARRMMISISTLRGMASYVRGWSSIAAILVRRASSRTCWSSSSSRPQLVSASMTVTAAIAGGWNVWICRSGSAFPATRWRIPVIWSATSIWDLRANKSTRSHAGIWGLGPQLRLRGLLHTWWGVRSLRSSHVLRGMRSIGINSR